MLYIDMQQCKQLRGIHCYFLNPLPWQCSLLLCTCIIYLYSQRTITGKIFKMLSRLMYVVVAGEDVRLFVFCLGFSFFVFPPQVYTHTHLHPRITRRKYSPVMCIENTCVAPNPQDALLSSALCSVFMYQQFILLYIFLRGRRWEWDTQLLHRW